MTARTPQIEDAAQSQRRVLNRLKRARGQLNALIDSLESGADCRSAVTQLAAVTSALDKAGFAIIAAAMRNCAIAEAAGDAGDAGAAGAANYPDSLPAASGDDDARQADHTSTAVPAPLTQAELEKLFLSLT